MSDLGIITLIPPIFIIVFALITRKTLEALLFGGILACILGFGKGFFDSYLGFLYETMSDTGNIWIILTIGLFGSFIALMRKARATAGFSQLVLKHSGTEKKSLLISWLLGIVIFVDDYLNVLAIGNAMRDVCDKQKTPREMLAYVVDSTGVPVCMLIPISTQVVFWAGMLENEKDLAAIGSGMDVYLKSIPFAFYSWAAVIIVPLVIIGVVPKLGAMKKAYTRTRETGMTYNVESDVIQEESTAEKTGGSLLDFFIPLAALIGGTIYFEIDLLYGAVTGVTVAGILYIIRRKINFKDFSQCFIDGFASMFLMMGIIVLALTLQKALAAIGMTDYIVGIVEPYMSANLLPAITFVVVALLSFVTGSVWGVPALTIPIIVPLAVAVGADPILTAAAIMSSATFGAHACFYSDVTVLTSSACGINNMDHALTQIPYALIAGSIAFVGYLICGFTM